MNAREMVAAELAGRCLYLLEDPDRRAAAAYLVGAVCARYDILDDDGVADVAFAAGELLTRPPVVPWEVVLSMSTACSHWPRGGRRCLSRATVWIYGHDGVRVPGGALCEEHGERIANEFAVKLGEIWPLVPIRCAS